MFQLGQNIKIKVDIIHYLTSYIRRNFKIKMIKTRSYPKL